MKNKRLLFACGLLLLSNLTLAQAPLWTRDNLNKACDRVCLVKLLDGYMAAIYAHDPAAVPPLAKRYRMTENTGGIEIGEGVLWRNKVQPTSFNIRVVDPVAGQAALQARVRIVGPRGAEDRLIAVRLKVDRGEIAEIEHLWAGNINEAAIELLTTPRDILTSDVPPAERISRDAMFRVANSYFDALEGDDGRIGAFADDCVRHENGYRTVNNPPPGGRMMPGPPLPDPNTEQGKQQLAFSMLTCAQQIDSKTFAYMKHIRPRRALVVDEQKGLVGTFPLFIHDGTRRGGPPPPPPPPPPPHA